MYSLGFYFSVSFFFFQAEDGIRDTSVTGVQTCALPIWTNHEDCSHGGVVRRRSALRGLSLSGWEHVVELGDLQLWVADHRIIYLVPLGFFDVLCPLAVLGDGVHAQSDDLAVAFFKFRLQSRHVAQFGGTDGSKIFRVRK